MTNADLASENDGKPSKKPKVLVIGAGTCGLRAAEVLIRAGCEVKVLEARDRVGGRIATTTRLGLPLDLGANWIHGNVGNPIIAIAEKVNSSYSIDELDDTIVFAPDGSLLPKRLGDEVVTKMWDYFDEGITYSAQNMPTIQPNVSFMEYYKSKIAAEEGWNEERRTYQLQIADLLGSIVATEIGKQDFRNLHMEEPIPGENLFLSSTYGPVMDLMAETVLKEDGCLELNRPVERVETVRVGGEGQVQRVYTKDGEVYTADAVLCSIPLGSLKQDRVKFDPPIPEKIRQSIKHLGYGSLEKTYITFPKAFWMDGPSYFIFLADSTASDRKTTAAISLAHIAPPHNQPTLLFYTHGATSKHLTSILQFSSPQESRSKILSFFHPYISKLPNYSPSNPDCVPRDYVSTNWLNDEYAGNGSYTNFPVGLVDGVEDVKVIEEGVEGWRVWFCGEHTAPLLGLASVSGAYWAGERAARRCLGAFGMEEEATNV
ncbi:uncharacterized protein DFL_009361 [Arthrobotrys flagrans]|uniref:Amine oxidase domain-containing protein n=1 Tax=Arthrobotrys flagrans TaxID=97331 RepID=A0A436ZRD7_ARTFL|nr:hypothetical protein DFL_009361 [Arthrobotrys flagrans]